MHSPGHCPRMGLLVGMLAATLFIYLFYFPSLHTNLDRALGPPCLCSVSKEKEQFVFVLFLLKGKPSLAKRNLNQIAGLKTQCKSTELSLGRERQLAAEVGEAF